MLFRSFVSSVRDSILLRENPKYKVHSLSYNKGDTGVLCEFLETGNLVELKLDDIISNNKLQYFCSNDVLAISKALNNKSSTEALNSASTKKYYNLITIAFVVLLLFSNLGETKISDFWGYPIGAGTIVFPLLYVLNDVLTEVYGFSASRRTIWIALFVNILFSIFMYGVMLLPPSVHWDGQDAFEQIFSVSPRIVFGSVTSYFIGELLNATIISFLKVKLSGRYFALRAIFSTFIGSFVESTMFGFIAFGGRLPFEELVQMIVLLTLIKVSYEILIMPFTLGLVHFLKTAEGSNVFEKPSLKSFMPQIL